MTIIFETATNIKNFPFQVVALPIDFSLTRHLLEPAGATEEKFLCCLCCQSGPIRLVSEIQKKAYHLGDQIIFSFELDNKETDKPLRKIEARLIQQFTFISNTGRIRETEDVKSSLQLSEGVSPRGEESWNDVALNIPTNIVPSFNNCKCMHLKYYFIVKVDIEAAFDPKVSFPITISSGPQIVQPTFQPLFMPGNVMPSAPPASLPPASYPPATGYPQQVVYPPATIAQQPATITEQPTTWNPDIPPPAYPKGEK